MGTVMIGSFGKFDYLGVEVKGHLGFSMVYYVNILKLYLFGHKASYVVESWSKCPLINAPLGCKQTLDSRSCKDIRDQRWKIF